MVLCLLVLSFSFLIVDLSEAGLLKAGKQCVPTATVQGPCHDCVCSSEGVFHCQRRQCYAVDLNQRRKKEDCQPNYLYRENATFCTCSDKGFWRSDNCQESFRFLHPTTTRMHYELRTNVICKPNLFYIIDCNVCRCEPTGFIDVTACTNRYCFSGHKADTCSSGDILRTDRELCACSDIHFYIDRLCIKIHGRPFQKIETEALSKLVDIGKSWRRVNDLTNPSCNTEIEYTVDCNKCVCNDGELLCTTKICELKRKIALRYEKQADKTKSEFESLPEVHNLDDTCTPGKSYRHKCYTCQCTDNDNVSGHDELPQIQNGDSCVDGNMYKMDCNTCTCKSNVLICSKMACVGRKPHKDTARQKVRKAKKAKRQRDTDKMFKVSDKEFAALPTLPHHAAYCTPSKKYRVDCNVCLCNNKKILLCDKKMCIDQKTTREIEADKKSGKPCSETFTSKKCVKCKCKNGKTQCEAKSVDECQTEEDKQLLSKSGSGMISRLTFDFKAQECMPDFVYRESCNKCYCQPDKSLRCTRKMCLNYVQALQLEEQREYLIKHGL